MAAGLLLSCSVVGGQDLNQVLLQGLTTIERQQWIIAGQVRSLGGESISSARIQIHYPAEGRAKNEVETNFQGKYSVTLELNAQMYTSLAVTVSAEKEGYVSARESATFTNKGETYPIDLVMLPVKQDGSGPQLDPLLNTLAPRFMGVNPPELKSSSDRQDFSRGVDLFFARHDYVTAFPLLSALTKKSPACVECRTLLGLVEIQAGGIAGARHELAEAALQKLRTDEESRKESSLIVLGVLADWSGEYPKSAGLLMQALKLAPQDPLALQELGRTLIDQKNWDAADEYLQKAEKAGAPPEAHLLRCRAVLGEGDAAEADREMRAFLGGRDIRSQAQATRVLYTQVQSQLSLRAYSRGESVVTEPLPQLLRELPELAGLTPAADQTRLPSILHGTALSVEAFFANFQNATSSERIEEEQLGKGGKVRRSIEQRFQYLLVSTPDQDGMSLDEYRTDDTGAARGPSGLGDGFMLTAGFASASLVFHPQYQAGAKFRLLGRASADGAPCDVVAFAQVPEKATMFGRFRTKSGSALVLHQGIAWVNPADSRIVRLRTDLLQPLPNVRLQRETTEIHYGLVHFKDVAAPISLPSQVSVTVEWKGKTFRNLHAYRDFKWFRTSAHEKRSAENPPAAAGPVPN
jgi:tetratricopeptide (TPR) repeat protein